MNSRETKRIRIYRKGNGCVLVDPGLAILKSDTDFDVVNTTDEDAVVAFDAEAFKPVKGAEAASGMGGGYAGLRYSQRAVVKINKRSAATFRTGDAPRYFEYEVLLLTSGDCAEGNSKPGGFVDP